MWNEILLPSWLNLPTEQAPTQKDHKKSLYRQSPQGEKQKESKVAKA